MGCELVMLYAMNRFLNHAAFKLVAPRTTHHAKAPSAELAPSHSAKRESVWNHEVTVGRYRNDAKRRRSRQVVIRRVPAGFRVGKFWNEVGRNILGAENRAQAARGALQLSRLWSLSWPLPAAAGARGADEAPRYEAQTATVTVYPRRPSAC